MTDNTDPPFAEFFWGAYLKFALETDPTITEADVPQMKNDFMVGLRGEGE